MEAVQHEIMGEMANALVRTEHRLIEARQAYREQLAVSPVGNVVQHEGALWDFVDAVLCFIVQREAIGSCDTRRLFDLYEVPDEVVRRIGVRRTVI